MEAENSIETCGSSCQNSPRYFATQQRHVDRRGNHRYDVIQIASQSIKYL